MSYKRALGLFSAYLEYSVLILLLQSAGQTHAQNVENSFSVIENATIGTEVGRLSDTATVFFLTSSDDSPFRNYFDVDRLEAEGIIITTAELDHEVNAIFDASVFNINTQVYHQVSICFFRHFKKLKILLFYIILFYILFIVVFFRWKLL